MIAELQPPGLGGHSCPLFRLLQALAPGLEGNGSELIRGKGQDCLRREQRHWLGSLYGLETEEVALVTAGTPPRVCVCEGGLGSKVTGTPPGAT